jgi:hypothetical protein
MASGSALVTVTDFFTRSGFRGGKTHELQARGTETATGWMAIVFV